MEPLRKCRTAKFWRPLPGTNKVRHLLGMNALQLAARHAFALGICNDYTCSAFY